jgi:hypothetical protein
VALGAPRALGAQLATKPADFVQPGTQPSESEFSDFEPPFPFSCDACHGAFESSTDAEISDAWVASMMAQAARDPLTRAAAAVANADAAGSAETCIRCHAPVGWLGGRSASADFEELAAGDLHGVTCHMCHRMLDPIARADAPAADGAILAGLDGADVRPSGTCAGGPATACTSDAACGSNGPCRVDAGQGRFVVDPSPLARRGPIAFAFHPAHPTVASPFHARAEACAPCHDVSTPTYTREDNGTYSLNELDAAHPTQDPDDMFPEQRTYSEWRASEFAGEGVVFPDGRFGGTRTATLPNTVPVSTCQDCHMADVAMKACAQGEERTDVAGHFFTGANTWVLGAVLDEYGAATSGLTTASVAAAATRTRAMLEAASDLEVTQLGSTLTVRVVNQTGHKLPTGYPEGRRMWLGVRFFAGDDPTPIAEDGAYDVATAVLGATSKVYEAQQVIDTATAVATGLPPGTPFHLVLSNHVEHDSRIPPRGFTNAAFEAFGGAPAGATYADGQHWDDTTYTIPAEATRVEVVLNYQSTSKEYIEFLRDNGGDAGQNAWDRWVARGRSAPVVMDRTVVDLTPICAPTGASCEDGDPCTTADTCDAGGVCQGGTPVSCSDDGNACTDDVCDSSSGACGMPRSGTCDDGDACTTGDSCNAGQCRGDAVGFDGLRCLLDALQSAEPCAEPLPKKLARNVRKRAGKASQLAGKAESKLAAGAKTTQVQKLLDRGAKSLAAIDTLAGKAVESRKESQRITSECADALRGLIARPHALIGQLRP